MSKQSYRRRVTKLKKMYSIKSPRNCIEVMQRGCSGLQIKPTQESQLFYKPRKLRDFRKIEESPILKKFLNKN